VHQLLKGDLFYIDCDLYKSAYCAMDWIMNNQLLSKKCIIAYDEFNRGEDIAHAEICQKHRISPKLIFEDDNGVQQKSFVILQEE